MPRDGQLNVGNLSLMLGKGSTTTMLVTVDRNLKGLPLPGAMSAADFLTLEGLMHCALKKLVTNSAFKGSYFTLTPGTENSMTEEAYRCVTRSYRWCTGGVQVRDPIIQVVYGWRTGARPDHTGGVRVAYRCVTRSYRWRTGGV
jgi:hypothetical protein